MRLLCKTYYLLSLRNRKKLYSFKNKHQGERCFIIGNGPSLNYEDLEKLKYETIFVSNSFVKILDKISFMPTYYFSQDSSVIKNNLTYLRNTPGLTKFIYSHFNQWRYYVKDAIRYIDGKVETVEFSDNIMRGVSGAWTVTQSMIQFAVFMGFKEIYLLGVDFNYAQNNTEANSDCYFDKTMFNQIHYPLPEIEHSLAAFAKSREYCENHGIKIYNATRGGKLEVFERMNFDDILKS